MSPRVEPPKGPQHSVYLKYLKALGNQELPYQISGLAAATGGVTA
jgi:hypothetical protein